MKTKVETPQQYIEQLADDRKSAVEQLRKTIIDNLPEGFTETISSGMIGYVVPHSIYPNGYHCDRKKPLPFINFASRKNFIALYHMGLYANYDLMKWFIAEYPKYCNTKLDMGKSCVRFKKIDEIPFKLIAKLCSKMTPEDWIKIYEIQLSKYK